MRTISNVTAHRAFVHGAHSSHSQYNHVVRFISIRKDDLLVNKKTTKDQRDQAIYVFEQVFFFVRRTTWKMNK